MKIQCPTCNVVYRLPDAKLSGENRNFKVPCKHCGAEIHLHGHATVQASRRNITPAVRSETAVSDGPPALTWFCGMDGRKVGPLTHDEVRLLILTDQLGPENLIWHAGFAQWVPVRNVPHFAEMLALQQEQTPVAHDAGGVRQTLPAVDAALANWASGPQDEPPPVPAPPVDVVGTWLYTADGEPPSDLPIIAESALIAEPIDASATETEARSAEPSAAQATPQPPPPGPAPVIDVVRLVAHDTAKMQAPTQARIAEEPADATPAAPREVPAATSAPVARRAQPQSRSRWALGIAVTGAASAIGMLVATGFQLPVGSGSATADAVPALLVAAAHPAPKRTSGAPAAVVAATAQEARLAVATAPEAIALVAVKPAPPTQAPQKFVVVGGEKPAAAVASNAGQRLTQRQVDSVAVQAAGPVSRCYLRNVDVPPQRETIRLRLVLSEDGTVASSTVHGKHAGDRVGKCVPGALKGLHFPQAGGPTRTYTVRYVVGG